MIADWELNFRWHSVHWSRIQKFFWNVCFTKLHFTAIAVSIDTIDNDHSHYWSPINSSIERCSISTVGIFTFGLGYVMVKLLARIFLNVQSNLLRLLSKAFVSIFWRHSTGCLPEALVSIGWCSSTLLSRCSDFFR